VAVSTGSGGSLVADFLRSDAQVFISGDLGYHAAREVEYAGRSLIDVGHFHSEHFMKEALVKRLQGEFSRRRMAVRVQACPLETDPFTVM
jgi:putative NIF3 family GTP cyclohydrolase 1 type 2